MAKEKQPEIVEQIKSMFMDLFKESSGLPPDTDLDEIVNSVNVDSELKRILAIPDRMSYLAKGIVSKTVRDNAQVAFSDAILLVRSVMGSGASPKSIERTINNIINLEFGLVMNILGLRVESEEESSKNNRIAKVSSGLIGTQKSLSKKRDPNSDLR